MTLLIIACIFGSVTIVFVGVGSGFKGHFCTAWSLIVCGTGVAIIPFIIVWEAARP